MVEVVEAVEATEAAEAMEGSGAMKDRGRALVRNLKARDSFPAAPTEVAFFGDLEFVVRRRDACVAYSQIDRSRAHTGKSDVPLTSVTTNRCAAPSVP